jgi:hypothetical protein
LSDLPEEPFTLVGILVPEGRNLFHDGSLVKLTRLASLRTLDLSGNESVTDKALRHLMPLKSLRELNLVGTRVTAEGIAKLRAALAGCKISMDADTGITQTPPVAADASPKPSPVPAARKN